MPETIEGSGTVIPPKRMKLKITTMCCCCGLAAFFFASLIFLPYELFFISAAVVLAGIHQLENAIYKNRTETDGER